MVFFNFLNFFAIFLEFCITRHVGAERKFLFSLFLGLFQPILASKEAIIVFFWFFEFFCYSFGISITGQEGTKRNDNFYFPSFSAFPAYFGLKRSHHGIFEFFSIFLPFFGDFLLRVGHERNGMIIFIFSLSQSFPTYFGMKWSRNRIF